jgi:hypothetical protein
MPIPDPLPEKLTVRFNPEIMLGIFTYCEFSDVTPSRLLQRAVERELLRRAKQEPKLKDKLGKLLDGTKPTRTRNSGK